VPPEDQFGQGCGSGLQEGTLDPISDRPLQLYEITFLQLSSESIPLFNGGGNNGASNKSVLKIKVMLIQV